ncbi:hypothetical protein AC1031_021953 [Aphanomyces cochlioides]|nr:hypothetical protein AC1031_021953 [Aphanomyces cochlioides]
MYHALIMGKIDVLTVLYHSSSALFIPEPQWKTQDGLESVDKQERHWICALYGGHLEVVMFLHTKNHPGYNQDVVDLTAERGLLPIVAFLLANGTQGCSVMAMDVAAANGHLETVKFLHTHSPAGCSNNIINEAIIHGHVDVVEWLTTHRDIRCSTEAFDAAAAQGFLKMVQWLSANRHETSDGFGCWLRPLERGRMASFQSP